MVVGEIFSSGQHTISLVVVMGVWVYGLFWGRRLAWRLGVFETADGWVIGYTLATGCLLAAFQMIGFAWLITGDAWVRPHYLASVYVLTLTVVLLVLGTGISPKRHVVAHADGRTRVLWLWFPMLVVFGAYCVFLADAVFRPPTGWDGLHYHLPMTVRWLQTRNAGLNHGEITQNFPGNGMVFAFVLLGAGLERVVSIAMVPQAFLTAVVVYAIAGRLGMRQVGRTIAACMALSLPMVMFQAFSTYVDLFATNAWLCALLAIMWSSEIERAVSRRRLMFIGGLACGIALGSKLTFIPATFMLLVIVAILPLMFRRPEMCSRSGPGATVQSLAIFVTAIALCSSFWYVRNAVLTGNPVYPMAVNVGNVALFDGVDASVYFPERPILTQIRRWWAYPWHEHRSVGYHYGVGDGLGATFATFVPLGVLACVTLPAFWNARRGSRRWRLVVLALAGTGPLLFATLCHQTFRFILPMILLSTILAAWFVERVAYRYPRWLGVALTTSLSVTGIVATLMPAKNMLGRFKDSVQDRSTFYEIPSMVDTLPTGSIILNLDAHTKNYALSGILRTNQVVGPSAWEQKLASQSDPSRESRHLDAVADFAPDYIFVSGLEDPAWLTRSGFEKVYDSTGDTGPVFGQPRRLFRVRELALTRSPSDRSTLTSEQQDQQ